jgi:hypothetical protein
LPAREGALVVGAGVTAGAGAEVVRGNAPGAVIGAIPVVGRAREDGVFTPAFATLTDPAPVVNPPGAPCVKTADLIVSCNPPGFVYRE